MPLFFERNDITKMRVDAIVNAANTTLLGGGGVDGAIHRAAGPKLLEECRTLHGCRTGEAKLTKGYNLPCKYVIHTAGPIWQGGHRGEKELLESCYANSLELARSMNCETVAFPLISAGVYGYPKADALQVAVSTISRFLEDNDMTVTVVLFTKSDFEVSGSRFGEIASYIDDRYAEENYYTPKEQEASAWREAYLRLAKRQTRGEALRTPQPAPEGRAEDAEEAPRRKNREKEFPCGSILADFAVDDREELDKRLEQVDESFAETLLHLIDSRNMTDAECYKRANIDRRHFNKIKNTEGYRPTKLTVLALSVALRLSLPETDELLKKAGYALTHTSKTDIIVEYFIENGCYDVSDINMALFEHDLQLLGSA